MAVVGIFIVIVIIIKILYDREIIKKNSHNEIINNPKNLEEPLAKENHDLQLDENKTIIHDIEDLKIKRPKGDEVPKVERKNISQTCYVLPQIEEIFNFVKIKKNNSTDFILKNKEYIEEIFTLFNIPARVVEIHIGPSVTQFEIELSPNVSFNRVINIESNIVKALSNVKAELQIPIPGKKTIGVEIPNEERNIVTLREVLESKENQDTKAKIAIPLGKNIIGEPIIADLTKLQTILIAGVTGSGKSVFINSLVASILMRYKPSEVKLVLIDPKKVELTNYNGIPHLLCPVVGDPRKASLTLQRIVKEMDDRFQLFSDKEVKDIDEYNKLVDKENMNNPEQMKHHMPYIITIIDELTDLMITAPKEVEDSIMRITQLARNAGIHLIVATQRTLNDILTKELVEGFQTKICFKVPNKTISKLILDQSGAEKLLGWGDMLFLDDNKIEPIRIQSCVISDEETKRLI